MLGNFVHFLLYKNRNFGGNGGSDCTLQYQDIEPVNSNSAVTAGWLQPTRVQNVAPVIFLSIIYF